MTTWTRLLVGALASLIIFYVLIPHLIRLCTNAIGSRVLNQTSQRKSLLIARAHAERNDYDNHHASSTSLDDEWEKVNRSRSLSSDPSHADAVDTKDWEGVIGFLHPFCNAGGGGERVLWAAIRATQKKWPKAICVVYTGDHDVTKEQILDRVQNRFNIHLYPPTVTFLYLSTRHYVLASTWPHFTLLGQSLGSLLLGWDAFNLVVPDIFIDTMGYAFTLAMSRLLFPKVPTGAYVHYPTISTDMLKSLDADPETGNGVNAGAGKGLRGALKKSYWRLFAKLYGWVGSNVDVVMTNSSWTQRHIQQLWGPSRSKRTGTAPPEVVYPPVAVKELETAIEISPATEKNRDPILLYIAQFRPEKDHQLVLRAFAEFLYGPSSPTTSTSHTTPRQAPTLLLIGSVRTSADETYIYSLRLLAHELNITSSVTFVLNASWDTILTHLRTASVGINAMWNEHFGIGVVEYQAAGLICVVNDSGGPKYDIVVDLDDGPTGYRALTEPGYANAFADALNLPDKDKVAMRRRARRNAERFDDGVFDGRWVKHVEKLVRLRSKAG